MGLYKSFACSYKTHLGKTAYQFGCKLALFVRHIDKIKQNWDFLFYPLIKKLCYGHLAFTDHMYFVFELKYSKVIIFMVFGFNVPYAQQRFCSEKSMSFNW